MIVKQLLNPTKEEIERIVDITVRSFSGNVAEKAFLGGNWTLHAEYCRAQTKATVLEGELYVGISESNGTIVSTASWFPPGKSLFGSEAQRALGYNEFLLKLSEDTKYWEKNIFQKIVSERVEPLFTEEEIFIRWWCYNLATDPKYRGMGFGTALMKLVADKADNLDNILGLVATTDQNVEFYRGVGYRVRGNMRVPAPTGDFEMHILTRDQVSKSYN